ncbi:MAG: hypothetical protein U9P38_08470 [Campylobacterota bacterium]|nr:hypothetical protein [Campylobacterota bacterium]
MQNPFESGHIKNYILAYVSVVVIMILFFVATTLFNEVETYDKKVFDTNTSVQTHGNNKILKNIIEINSSQFKLMDKAY